MFPRSRRIVRPEVAGGHPNDLECDRNDLRGRDKTSRLDQTSIERKLTQPAMISNGRKRFAGLRHHATRPQTT